MAKHRFWMIMAASLLAILALQDAAKLFAPAVAQIVTPFLQRKNNLSDILSASTARTNLGVSIVNAPDYAAGTWSPTLNSWTNVGTPTVSGYYVKMGALVCLEVTVVPATSISATAGTSTITGLPLTATQLGTMSSANESSGGGVAAGALINNGGGGANAIFPGTTGVVSYGITWSGCYVH